jgi:hypothetical protein
MDSRVHRQARYAYDRDGNRIFEQYGNWSGVAADGSDGVYTPVFQNMTAAYADAINARVQTSAGYGGFANGALLSWALHGKEKLNPRSKSGPPAA